MPFVKAQANEYLVVGRRGKIASLGQAASAYVWPGSTQVLIPSTQQEAAFEMTQESKDCIPLRFKGIVIYHVADAELAARHFNFAGRSGVEEINKLINHICLGELRATVAHLTMNECIEQRKTTLTDAIASALCDALQGSAERPGWGIAVDVVQVAQVFIVDQELRRQLEAEVRNAIKVKSDLSELQMRENVQRAEGGMQRRLQQEHLDTERERTMIAHEKLRLQKGYEQAEIEANHPLAQLRVEKDIERLQLEVQKRAIENRLEELKVEAAMLQEKARHALKKELLPLEQAPKVAEALGVMFRGMHLSVIGQEMPLVASMALLLELMTQKLREGLQTPAV
jgi:hypothetical protein